MKKRILLFLLIIIIVYSVCGCTSVQKNINQQPNKSATNHEQLEKAAELGELLPIPDSVMWTFGDDIYITNDKNVIDEIFDLAKPCISKTLGYIALDYGPDIAEAQKNGKLEYQYSKEQLIIWQSPSDGERQLNFDTVSLFSDLGGESVLILNGAIGGVEFSDELFDYCQSQFNNTDQNTKLIEYD